MKFRTRTVSGSETGSTERRSRHQPRQQAPKRYSFLDDSCMARAMNRL
ncbi:hypothetical protein H7J50_00435 [Mycobacterium intermedium]|nr:hypothetical protein [Mycobacterium intermedium]MCV6962293.1 hypothetical protein [Mycobacterium intermedium]